MTIRTYGSLLLVFIALSTASRADPPAINTALIEKAQYLLNQCAAAPKKMDQALTFIKDEITYHTKLPLATDPDWIPKPLMNEKLSLSYDNVVTSRKGIDLDCQSALYITALVSTLQTGGTITADDSTLIEGTATRLSSDMEGWKHDYTVFWQVLHETMQQYRENTSTEAKPR